MTPATIIREAQAAGVRLSLSNTGTIKAAGNVAVVNRWLPAIRERKAEIIDVLKGNSAAHLPAPITADDEAAIRGWLARIGETDPVTIAEVIDGCRRDADARDYFLGRAATECVKTAPGIDDRRTCDQCANLKARRCEAAKRGEFIAGRNYEPIPDLLRRCEGYTPCADDPDQRHGGGRWPGI